MNQSNNQHKELVQLNLKLLKKNNYLNKERNKALKQLSEIETLISTYTETKPSSLSIQDKVSNIKYENISIKDQINNLISNLNSKVKHYDNFLKEKDNKITILESELRRARILGNYYPQNANQIIEERISSTPLISLQASMTDSKGSEIESLLVSLQNDVSSYSLLLKNINNAENCLKQENLVDNKTQSYLEYIFDMVRREVLSMSEKFDDLKNKLKSEKNQNKKLTKNIKDLKKNVDQLKLSKNQVTRVLGPVYGKDPHLLIQEFQKMSWELEFKESEFQRVSNDCQEKFNYCQQIDEDRSRLYQENEELRKQCEVLKVESTNSNINFEDSDRFTQSEYTEVYVNDVSFSKDSISHNEGGMNEEMVSRNTTEIFNVKNTNIQFSEKEKVIEEGWQTWKGPINGDN